MGGGEAGMKEPYAKECKELRKSHIVSDQSNDGRLVSFTSALGRGVHPTHSLTS